MSQVPNEHVPATHHADPLGEDDPHRPADDKEEVYYEGSPRLRGNLSHVVLWSLLGILFILAPVVIGHYTKIPMRWYVTVGLVVVGIIFLIVPILIVKRTRYRVTNYRIDFERGWLSTDIDTMELWHVEDIKFHQSLLGKIFGVGTIEVFSHDDTTPNLFLHGVPHARQLFSTLQQRIIAVKRQRGVIKMDTGT